MKNYCIAVVGTRRASPYGKWVATRIGKEISNLGFTHVSGMAWGIDAIGHEAVLSQGGKSIAVLGTGVDVCFPKSSLEIYKQLSSCGLIVSEYPPGTVGYPGNFPERNRIISGLSQKIIVVEAAIKSGSLITAKLALEQGRDVYAVPGNINQPNSLGTNLLIADGANPVYDINNLGQNLGLESVIKDVFEPQLSILQKEIIEKIKECGSLTIDELSIAMDLSISYLLSELTLLEIKGFVKNNYGIISL